MSKGQAMIHKTRQPKTALSELGALPHKTSETSKILLILK
jgi:hypothetical protein